MTSPALNRRTRQGFNKGLGRTRNAPLKIEWKTLVVREWEEDGVKHNSHRHYLSITCVNEEAHIHTHDTDEDSGGDGYCGIGVNHDHSCTVNAGEAHNHVFSGYTGVSSASDLLHTHTIGITSQAGSAHSHNLPANWDNGSCTADGCAADPHFHVAGGANADESLHTHGLNGATGNGSGLLRWHTHSVNFACEVGSAHTHIVGTATIANANCHTLYDHNHGGGVEESSAENTHVHNVVGDTEEEGEPVDGSDNLYAKFDVGQNSAELLGKFEAQVTAELLGKADITHSAELLSNFRVSCPRRMGGNWQRKMWFEGTYYWRGRYDPIADELIFEYIAADGLAGNAWIKNANASIGCSGFDADWIIADFTVRGGETGIKTTIHYSDGVDTWVAESDEASLTGWAWQNLTKVFDGTAPDYYRKVNLAANRKSPPELWVIAVFYDDDPDGKQWVKARKQTKGGDITGWDAEVDISNVDNTDTVYGCSVRSMGEKGTLKSDMMVVYKEGDALRSRYYNGTWQAIQDIDTTTLLGRGAWDFEHGEAIGVQMGHIAYVDADGSVKWRERDSGAAEVWSAAETLHDAADHIEVAIAEHGAGWLWAVWGEGEVVLEYRLHQCLPEVWFPLLANPALSFNVNTDAVVKTSSVRQLQIPDGVPAGEAVPMSWIGETAPATPCAAAWGILIEYSVADLMGMLDIRQLTSTDLSARLEVGQDSAELPGKFEAQTTSDLLGNVDIRQLTAASLLSRIEIRHMAPLELLGRGIIRHVGSPVEILSNVVIRHVGSPVEILSNVVIRHVGSPVEILSNVVIRHVGAPVELLGRAIIRQPGSAELLGNGIIKNVGSAELLDRAVIRHVGSPVEILSNVVIRHVGAPVELLGRAIIRQPGSTELPSNAVIRYLGAPVELLSKAIIRQPGSTELLGNAVIRHVGTPRDLLARFEVGQNSEILYGRFRVSQDFANLFTKTEIRQRSSAELLGKIDITHSVELLGKGEIRQCFCAELLSKVEVGQNSAELLGRFEAQAIAELLGRAKVQHPDSAELLGNSVIRQVGTPAELLGRFVVRHIGTPIDLPSEFSVRHEASVDLLSGVVIRHTGIPRELVARCVIRNRATKDLDANVVIVHWEDLYCEAIICHTVEDPLPLPAIFWVRFPRRLWTSRRYINGVIELDEKLLGDASLEYVIEGVMEDTQGYLDNASLSYSEWTSLELVPVQILRAVTYGTVAALYARHTQTFRSQVIPSVTPVTVTVIGDAEKAMNYWEDRMNQMLEFYVTSQGGDVMLTSTPDEEPVFSMEDIPEEVTEFVSWRVWLQERGN